MNLIRNMISVITIESCYIPPGTNELNVAQYNTTVHIVQLCQGNQHFIYNADESPESKRTLFMIHEADKLPRGHKYP